MAPRSAVQPIQTELPVAPAPKLALAPVPVARPWLPRANALLPYLTRMDEARWYSNFGPLLTEFEERLAARFGQGACVVTAANATQALALTLRAMDLPAGSLCMTPAYTFVATAHAIIEAGLTPYFVDVDTDDWMLDPAKAAELLNSAPGPVSAVVPVAAFGAMPDLEGWRAFRAETGVPVLIDAAAAFDAAADCDLPLVVSLHATKVLGIGEGGFLATWDKALAERVRQLTTYGFCGSRESAHPATNAKLSEYAGAVGLAALDAWPHDRLRYLRTSQKLRMTLTGTPEVIFQAGWGLNWTTSVCCVRLPDGTVDAAEKVLNAHGIQTRRWWGLGCQSNPAFADCPRTDLPNTERLGASVLGLPFAIDLGEDEIDRVAAALREALPRPVRPVALAPPVIAKATERAVHPYSSARYVNALSDGRLPLAVPEWAGFVVRRPIAGGGYDGAGSYPMAPLPLDADVEGGLERCRRAGLVSLVMVPDPLSSPVNEALVDAFDLCRPFKTHYLIEPAAGAFDPSKHHRERIRRGHRRCRIEMVSLTSHLAGWRALYDGLVDKRGINGMAAFSDDYFAALAAEPALRAFAAYVDDQLAGMTLWFDHRGAVYNHLTASNATGYANGANYALYDAAISHFAGGVINLGGAAGASDAQDGLAQFKQGFANSQTQAWICGAILDPERYAELSGGARTNFFPAYRSLR